MLYEFNSYQGGCVLFAKRNKSTIILADGTEILLIQKQECTIRQYHRLLKVRSVC